MAATARYLQSPAMQLYAKSIYGEDGQQKNPLQSPIDSFALKMVDHYFVLAEGFVTETQTYTADTKQDQRQSNVTIATVDNGELKKAFLIEAKRFPNPKRQHPRPDDWYTRNETVWEGALGQLTGYMNTTRAQDKWQHDMYGIVLVGDMVRFYVLQARRELPVEYESPQLSRAEKQKRSFSIRTDSLLVEKVLLDIKALIKRDRDYSYAQ